MAFVRGPLPQADAVCFGMRWSWWLSLLLMGRSCSFALGSSSLDLVGVGGFHRVPSPLSSFGMWSSFGVNSAFLSLLIANEGFHWRWFLLRCSLPFRGSVVVFPTSSVGLSGLLVAGDHAFTWLVTVLASTLSSPGFLCCLARSLRCAALLYLWLCAHRLLGHGIPRLLACPSPSNRL